MIVVADATPLRYLVFIGAEHALAGIFGTVHAPPEVLRIELQGKKTPQIVKDWASSPPSWLIEKGPARIDETLPEKLHKGEIEAISLAQELGADFLLMDDWAARRAATARGFKVAGTLAILEEAAVRGLLEIEPTVEKLRATNYYASEDQYKSMIENVGSRNQAREAEQARPPAPEQKRAPEQDDERKQQRGRE